MTAVMVTGGGGYIGSVLTRMLLKLGKTVEVVDRLFFGRDKLPITKNLVVRQRDTRDLQVDDLLGFEAVLDLAALSNDPAGELDPAKTWEINHEARVRTARLAREAGVKRYLLPSSSSVYGQQEIRVDEDALLNPLSVYAEANLAAEHDVLGLCNGDFVVTVIRQATVYGMSPRMRFDLVLNGMVRSAVIEGVIRIFGNGQQWRPLVHVRDTSTAMIRILGLPPAVVAGRVFNIGSDSQNVRVINIAEAVRELVNVQARFEFYGGSDERSHRMSFTRAQTELDFKPAVTIADGVREVADSIRANPRLASDPQTITVQWYKRLITANDDLACTVSRNGQIL